MKLPEPSSVPEPRPPRPPRVSPPPPADPAAHARPLPRRRESRFDPQEMSLRGRIGAYRLHATHDPRETTQRARDAFDARFLHEVDPEGVLPEAERRRRAAYARKAYFAQLALRRAVKRRARPARGGRPPAAATEPPVAGAEPDRDA